MNYSNNIQKKRALESFKKIVRDKKIILESIREGVSTAELKKKGINVASPI